MDKAGIIVLNFNGAKDTIECIKSIDFIKYPYTIYVVDNASSEADYNLLRSNLSSEVVLISSKINLGYAGGNNLGIKRALSDGCDYICILNNDTVVTMDFLTKCINELKNNQQIAFIGPVIVDYSTKRVQSSGAMVNTFTGESRLLNYGRGIQGLPSEIECDYIGGACIVCSKETVDKIGMIPECYFLFFEETEWCCKAKRMKMKSVCIGETSILHKGSVSIKKIAGLNEYLMERNRAVFIRRNCRPRILSYLGYIQLIIMACVKGILQKNVSGYIRYYRDGWKNIVDYKRFPFIIINE